MSQHPAISTALLAGALGLSGCAGLATPGGAAALKAGLQHLETCERHYAGGTGLGAMFTFRIDCMPQPDPRPADRPPAVP
jgi:hypothetical protein